MEIDVLKQEMAFFGCVEFYHPEKHGYFYVMEQKMVDGEFIPLEHGAYCFYISPDLVIAERTVLNSMGDIASFLQQKISGRGFIHMEEDLYPIPKAEYVKWQISPRIRFFAPQ